MEIAELIYQGHLRNEVRHLASGQTLITDAPIDNYGKGQAFSPTDLLCVSLASCMVTLMGIEAATSGFDPGCIHIRIFKKMKAVPRKVHTIEIQMRLSGKTYTEAEKIILRRAAETCPVALSLHPEIKQVLQMEFD